MLCQIVSYSLNKYLSTPKTDRIGKIHSDFDFKKSTLIKFLSTYQRNMCQRNAYFIEQPFYSLFVTFILNASARCHILIVLEFDGVSFTT